MGTSSDLTVGSLEMSADKNVEVGNSTEIDIAEDGSLTSTGSSSTSDVTMVINSVINADSLDIIAGDDTVMQTTSEVHITNNFHMQAATSGDCSISGSAVVDAGTESGNCL